MDILLYPVSFGVFWFYDLPKLLLHKFSQINTYALNLFSVPLLLKTFSHPLKNEYREGLVLFSRIAGIIVKTILLLISSSLLLVLIAIELTVLILVVTLPFWWLYVLFLR